MRSTTDNTSEYEHNWIDQLRQRIEPHAQAVADAMVPVLRQDDSGIVDFSLDDDTLARTIAARANFGADSVRAVATEKVADFDVTYAPSGYIHPVTGEHVIPTYKTGTYRGEPADQYILRADTRDVVGNMSGRYPTRDGYKHVFDTLDSMFPNSCEGITVYGSGERVVVEQVLDEPFDLGNGDLIQPYIYTRMSRSFRSPAESPARTCLGMSASWLGCVPRRTTTSCSPCVPVWWRCRWLKGRR